jgi:hypothetical protein
MTRIWKPTARRCGNAWWLRALIFMVWPGMILDNKAGKLVRPTLRTLVRHLSGIYRWFTIWSYLEPIKPSKQRGLRRNGLELPNYEDPAPHPERVELPPWTVAKSVRADVGAELLGSFHVLYAP